MIKDIFDRIRLANGMEMPGFGFGCYKAFNNELELAVIEAIRCGYRYIDSAAFYENEITVGKAIKDSGMPRNELFIVSKIWPSNFSHPIAALDQTLADLGLDYVDGYLLHWPGLDAAMRWHAFEKLLGEQEKGKIGILGVSNFQQKHLERLHEKFGLYPLINQIEVHPLYQEKDLCNFCAGHGVQVISWSPLGRGKTLAQPVLVEMASELGKSPAQIILRWQIQKDYVPIPKSVHVSRIKENADIFNFSLTDEQMDMIDALDPHDDSGRTGKDPDVFPPLE